jgi:16S rRNA processing protein RimM
LRQGSVLVGVIAGAHGIQGEVKVKSFTAEPCGIGGYGPVQTEGGRPCEIVSVRPLRTNEVILRISGVDTRNAAEALKGQKLYVPRSALPEPQAGEYYHTDLIGLRAESPDGRFIGEVSTVLNYRAGDILEITLADGRTELVPFTDRHVPVVDFATGRVVVNVPPTDEPS